MQELDSSVIQKQVGNLWCVKYGDISSSVKSLSIYTYMFFHKTKEIIVPIILLYFFCLNCCLFYTWYVCVNSETICFIILGANVFECFIHYWFSCMKRKSREFALIFSKIGGGVLVFYKDRYITRESTTSALSIIIAQFATCSCQFFQKAFSWKKEAILFF